MLASVNCEFDTTQIFEEKSCHDKLCTLAWPVSMSAGDYLDCFNVEKCSPLWVVPGWALTLPRN